MAMAQERATGVPSAENGVVGARPSPCDPKPSSGDGSWPPSCNHPSTDGLPLRDERGTVRTPRVGRPWLVALAVPGATAVMIGGSSVERLATFGLLVSHTSPVKALPLLSVTKTVRVWPTSRLIS